MSRRTERVAKLLQHALGQIILRELADPRIDPACTSVTRVQIAEDLLRAKVYVSIMGPDAAQRRGIEALNHAVGKIQASLGRTVKLRIMPALEFCPDEQFKGALKTWDLIRQAMDEIRQDEQARAAPPAGPDQPEAGLVPAEPAEASTPPRQPHPPESAGHD